MLLLYVGTYADFYSSPFLTITTQGVEMDNGEKFHSNHNLLYIIITRANIITYTSTLQFWEGYGYQTKYVKNWFSSYYQVRHINCQSKKNALVPNRRNSLPITVRTSRKWLCNQRAGCLRNV